ncbi:unnamed protein product [Symbiodinium natans]|uniref:Uncharacterized protein n=1 Tax=Symbiodinium natans TaxID=878477 RepID=A0A812SQ56_9DINO|nr:unnamed protein product [Symbiodinium natans]
MLLEKSQARAQRFEHFVLEYLLKVPEGPSLNLSNDQECTPSAASAAAGIPRNGHLPAEELTGLVKPSNAAVSQLDEEIAEVEALLVQSMQRAAALKKEASSLAGQLGLIEAAEETAGHTGLPALAAELAFVARKVNKLTGKENRDYFDFNQQVSQTKRRGFLEDWEEEEAEPWPDTPKRPRFGLLG